MKSGPKPISPELRFWPKVNKKGPFPSCRPSLGRCWIWTGATAKGYGRFFDGQDVVQAHVWLYERTVRRVPVGKELDHLCRTRKCIRPSHVQPVTRRLNIIRGASGIAAQAKQTTCVHGHPLRGKNLYRHKSHRYCRTCRVARNRIYRRMAR